MKQPKSPVQKLSIGDQLRNIFAVLHSQLEQLNQCFVSQEAALSKQDMQAHQNSLNQQAKWIDQIEAKQGELQNLCKKYRLDFTKEGMFKLIKAQGGSKQSELFSEWQNLAASLKKVRRTIEIQQKIVHHSQQSVQNLLSLIKGQLAQGELYQPDGKKSKSKHHHISAEI